MSESYDAPTPTTPMTDDRGYRIREGAKAYANLGNACEFESSSNHTIAGAYRGAQTEPVSEDFTLQNIDAAMRYQPWNRYQCEQGEHVREALTHAARVILRHCPPGQFRSVALRGIIDARMNANAAISFQGRF